MGRRPAVTGSEARAEEPEAVGGGIGEDPVTKALQSDGLPLIVRRLERLSAELIRIAAELTPDDPVEGDGQKE